MVVLEGSPRAAKVDPLAGVAFEPRRCEQPAHGRQVGEGGL
jgi:hypothetical protein